MKGPSSFKLLQRFLQLYWLKPFDAVNDTANAVALRSCRWAPPILEIGSGDGVFSFIMHGGVFAFEDDRYTQSDLNRSGDIFDVYERDLRMTCEQQAQLRVTATIDMKRSHLYKCGETGLYDGRVQAPPFPLPFRSNCFRTVFLYFPHGLAERNHRVNYEKTLADIRRVLRDDGRLVMTAFDREVKHFFVCDPLARFFKSLGFERMARYFHRLDSGRCKEISGLSKTMDEWKCLMVKSGFRLRSSWNHIRPLAWRVYDLQTRPVLRFLIRWSKSLEKLGCKGIVKNIWVHTLAPFLWLFYLVAARPNVNARGGLLYVFECEPLAR